MVQRDEFIERLSKKGYTKHDAGIVIDDFIATLQEALIKGESVMFRGFGSFEVRERAARDSISPQTKERITIPAYRSAHFTAGKLLKRLIKEGAEKE